MQIWQAYGGSEGELGAAGRLEDIATNRRGVDGHERRGGDRRRGCRRRLRDLGGRTTSHGTIGDRQGGCRLRHRADTGRTR